MKKEMKSKREIKIDRRGKKGREIKKEQMREK